MGAHERCPRAVSQGRLFCSSTMVPAGNVWGQSLLPVPLSRSYREVFSAWLVQRGHSTRSCTSHLCQGTVQGLLSSGSSQRCWKLQLATKREGLDQGAAPRGMFLAQLCPQPLPPLFVSFLLHRARTGPALNFSDLSGIRKQLLLLLLAPETHPSCWESLASSPCLWHCHRAATAQLSQWELLLAHPRQSPRDEPGVSLLTPQRPSDPTALLAQGLAACSSKIPSLDT